MKILLIFTLCLISDGGDAKEVTGYSGGGVLIKCKYDTEYTRNPKYFCKDSWTGCSDQIKTGDKNEWINSGRFSLFDDTESAEFRVMIRELTVQDTGTYQCGVDKARDKDIYTPVELKVKKEALVSREVSAYAGGGINIKCRYEDEYKDKAKSFCKIGTHQWCFNGITTKPLSEWLHDGRFSIYDNRSAGFFSVFIRELITEDTGSYACAVVVSDDIEIYTVVKLNVTEDQSYEKSISETVHVGGALKVSCKYPESLRSDHKFLYKMSLECAACSYKESVNESRKVVNEGKFSLYDDRERRIFTVSIRNVGEQDSGEYWCGTEAAWTSDTGYKLYFTQIILTVTDPPMPVPTSIPTPSSSSSYQPLPISSPAGFPASTVITVSVILLLLLTGLISLTLAIQRRHKMQAGTASTGSSGQDSGNNQRVPLAVCDYEEIKDVRRLSASEAGFSTVCSTALSTVPSDPQTVYANTEFPTNSGDSAHTVYSTIQQPAISPDQHIYSTPSVTPTSLG